VIELHQRMEFYAAMLKASTFTRGALAVAFVLLYRHLNGRTGRCDPSILALADETGLTARGIQKAIAELRETGWWQIGQGIGRGHTNSYLPHLEKANAGPPISAGKGEPRCALSPPENTNGKVRKHEPPFTRTSKNQNHTIDVHRSAACSARLHELEGEDGVNDDFECFWRIYPHRGQFADPKQPARLKFEVAVRRGVDPATIIAGAERYRAHVEEQNIKAQYVAQAKTWLNEERWAQAHEPEVPRLRFGMN
jgi:hypothetical protein